MTLKKYPLKGEAKGGQVAMLLALYFLMVFPAAHFFLRGATAHAALAYPLFLLAALVYLLATGRVSLSGLGLPWPAPWGHLALGAALAALPLLALPLFDNLITTLGLDETELLRGAVSRGGEEGGLALAMGVIVTPLLMQAVFTGFVGQYLINRFGAALGIYLAGMVFALAHFKLSLGVFLIGLFAAGLFRLSGTLYAPMLLHLGSALAGEWLARGYPRLVTLFGFLF